MVFNYLSWVCDRCQLGPYCTENPCKNNGRCIGSLDGPVCECEPGFQGDRYMLDRGSVPSETLKLNF